MTESTTTTDTGRPQPGTDHGNSAQPLLASDQRDDLRRHWMYIEESFVDDPAAAVARADDLVDDAIDHIRATLSDRRITLRSRWEALEDDATTEQLRAALHDYERLFTQLSGFSAPTGWDDDEPAGRPTTHGRSTFRPSAESAESIDNRTDRTGTDRPDSEKGARS